MDGESERDTWDDMSRKHNAANGGAGGLSGEVTADW